MAKAAAKKAAKAAAPKKEAVRPMTKNQLLGVLAEKTELTKAQVGAVFEALEAEIQKSLSGKGAGEFTVPPGLMKIKKKEVPPKPAREGRNPHTGEKMMIAAKPARTTVKISPLKTLKGMVEK